MFDRASSSEQRADQLAGSGVYAEAVAGYRSASADYEEAERLATAAAGQVLLKQASETARTERLRAQQVEADKLVASKAVFSQGLASESEGKEAGLSSDFSAAIASYKAAAEFYGRAATLAVGSPEAAAQRDRNAMLEAKVAADKVSASALAKEIYDGAKKQMASAEAKLGQGLLDDAAREFRVAQAGFEKARESAAQQANDPDKQAAENAQKAMLRIKAVCAGVEKPKEPFYGWATRTETRGDSAYKAGNFAKAKKSYDDAAKFYKLAADQR